VTSSASLHGALRVKPTQEWQPNRDGCEQYCVVMCVINGHSIIPKDTTNIPLTHFGTCTTILQKVKNMESAGCEVFSGAPTVI
jgi:hypothetical protein